MDLLVYGLRKLQYTCMRVCAYACMLVCAWYVCAYAHIAPPGQRSTDYQQYRWTNREARRTLPAWRPPLTRRPPDDCWPHPLPAARLPLSPEMRGRVLWLVA